MGQIVGLAISGLALLVALYGIVERRRAAFAAIRVKLVELLGVLEELNLEELRYEDEHADAGDAPQYARYGFAGRRALVTYEALELLDRLRAVQRHPFGRPYRLTAAEHGSLAYSLRRGGDLLAARDQWQESLTAKAPSALVRAANHRGYADTLFALGRLEPAREQFRKSIEVWSDRTGVNAGEVFQTYLDWLGHEKYLPAGRPDEPARAALEIARADRTYGPVLLTELRAAATTTVVGADGAYRERLVGLEGARVDQVVGKPGEGPPGPDGLGPGRARTRAHGSRRPAGVGGASGPGRGVPRDGRP